MKIVCVDDEKLVLKLVVHFCEQLPQVSEVVAFSSSLEALEYMKSNSADLALLDIEMPKMNGIKQSKVRTVAFHIFKRFKRA